MSYMELYTVHSDGNVVLYGELHNSWRGAALVWTELGNKYLGQFDFEHEAENARKEGRSPDYFGWERTFKLQHSNKISEQDWTVLQTTFDNVIVPIDQMEFVAEQFKKFHQEFSNSHYLSCALALLEMKQKGYQGFCVNATSVNANPWADYDQENDCDKPYNIFTGTRHWFFEPRKEA